MAELDRDREERDAAEESDEIKVTDRRLFTREGVLRDETGPDDDEPAATSESSEPVKEEPDQTEAAASSHPGSGAGFEHRPIEEPEGVDFTMLINAMAQPALIFLGEIAHPGSGEPEINLEQARLQIDLLDLLRIRCRGNMTAEEEGLLDRILYQLRMLFVARSSPGTE